MKVKLIFGPPGTGKTTTLKEIVRQEIASGVFPDKIAYTTFTKKGAEEGRLRVMQELDYKVKDLPYFQTLHSFCFTALGAKRDDMIQPIDYQNLSKALNMKFFGYYTTDLRHSDDEFIFFNDLNRTNKKAAEEMRERTNLNPDLAEYVRRNYNNYKTLKKIYDFTDLLEISLQRKITLPVNVAIIDEAQDLTTLQWAVCRQLFANCDRVYIAGDDDQAIFEWSGADVDCFLNFGEFIGEKEKVILEKSYRLPANIFSYAKKISDRIEYRQEKSFLPKDDPGSITVIEDFREITFDESSTYTFMARNNYHLKAIEIWLQEKGVVYETKEGFSIDNKIIKGINAYTKYKKGEYVDEAEKLYFKRWMDEEKYQPETWFQAFTKMPGDLIDYYRNVIANKTDLTNCRIRVSTIHGMKGREADNVILLLDYTKEVDRSFTINPDSELRCYYVAVTRAKKNLYLVRPQSRKGFEIY